MRIGIQIIRSCQKTVGDPVHACLPLRLLLSLREFLDGAPNRCGVGGERRSRPSRVALNHATKDLDSTMYALFGSASGHMMLLPPIHIPQAPLPLCSHPYSDPTRLVLHGDARLGGQRL